MIDLLFDILLLDERRLRRRLMIFGLEMMLPLVFVALAIVWASVLGYLALSSMTGTMHAAMAMAGVSLVLALGVALLGARALRRGYRRSGGALGRGRGFGRGLGRDNGDALAAGLVDILGDRGRDRGHTDDLVALAMLVADHLDGRPRRRG